MLIPKDLDLTLLILEKLFEVEDFVNKMIQEELIVSTEIMPIDKAKKLGAMALFSEKYGDVVRVVKIGKSIELCGGTHTTNTKDIKKFAISSCESKGSNVYRIEAVTGDRVEDSLFSIIKPYNDEMIRILMKAKEVLEEARRDGFKLEFDVEINNDKPKSYRDIIYNRNELQYVRSEENDLEIKYNEMKSKAAVQNLDIYREHVQVLGDVECIIMKVQNKDIDVLKTIIDTLIMDYKNGFILFANVKNDHSVNFVAKSTSNISAGDMVKKISIACGGKGGGNPTFAQGGAKSDDNLDNALKEVEKEIK